MDIVPRFSAEELLRTARTLHDNGLQLVICPAETKSPISDKQLETAKVALRDSARYIVALGSMAKDDLDSLKYYTDTKPFDAAVRTIPLQTSHGFLNIVQENGFITIERCENPPEKGEPVVSFVTTKHLKNIYPDNDFNQKVNKMKVLAGIDLQDDEVKEDPDVEKEWGESGIPGLIMDFSASSEAAYQTQYITRDEMREMLTDLKHQIDERITFEFSRLRTFLKDKD